MNFQKCQQGQTAYLTAIPYAIKKLNTLPNVVQYVDAAHGGYIYIHYNMSHHVVTFLSICCTHSLSVLYDRWLGWPNNMQGFATIMSQVLATAGTFTTF